MATDEETPVNVGVLALQGNFESHEKRLAGLGATVHEVRKPAQLNGLAGLIIPGGESTALLKLMDYDPTWWPELEAFHDNGGVLFGTCAGLILLAQEVTAPTQRSLGLIDVTVERNSYGRQIDSFETSGTWDDGRSLEMVFIRAPRILRVGEGVTVRATHNGVPVLVEQGRVLAGSFHPELTRDDGVHRRLLEMIQSPA